MIITRAPFRITLGGGGTDLPSFYEKNEGFVLTMAIDKHIYVTFKKNILEPKIRLQYLKTEFVETLEELEHERAREALLLHDIHKGAEISSIADLPSQAGLGSSGSYLVALLTALRCHKKLSPEPKIIAEEACRIEIDTLKEPVGKQDQYIAAFGGVKSLNIDRHGKVETEDLNLSQSNMQDFLSSVHIYYTGILRSASEILKEQSSLQNNAEDNLKQIKDIGYEVKESLLNTNFDNFGLLMDKHWQLKKQLSKKITLSSMDELYNIVKERFGVLGGKIIGAGGGGFIMLYAPKNRAELESFMKLNGYPRVNYNIDYSGCQTIANFG